MNTLRPSIPAGWPSGPVPWMIVLTYVPMLLVAFWPGSRQLPLLDSLWKLAITLNRNEHNVQLLMTAAMGVHTLEALFTAWLCWDAGLSHEQLMILRRWSASAARCYGLTLLRCFATLGTYGRSWCGLTLLLGYGAIRPLRVLIKTAKSKPTAAAAVKDR